MKKASRYLALIIVVLPIFLLLTAPAEMAGWIMQKALGPAATLDRPEGSLWNGRAKGLILAGQGTPIILPDFSWRVQWPALMDGEVALELGYQGDGNRSVGTVARGRHGFRLKNVDAVLPGSLLPSLVPALQNILGGGEIRIHSRNFRISADEPGSGESELVWSNVSSPFSEVNPLGDFRARLAPSGQAVSFRLDTLEGPLRLDGSGTWSLDGGLVFDGTARSDPGRRAELEPVLQLLGTETSDGARRLSIR